MMCKVQKRDQTPQNTSENAQCHFKKPDKCECVGGEAFDSMGPRSELLSGVGWLMTLF